MKRTELGGETQTEVLIPSHQCGSDTNVCIASSMLVSIRSAPVEAAMSSAQYLREFIKERLTAVCEEIFSEVQKTIVQYEEEINRQHRLLDISRKPDRNSHIIDLPQQHDCEEEEGLDEQQVCNQERNSSLDQEDPETPQIKEEQEELCSSQKGEQLGLKQEAEGIIVWTDEKQLRLLETIWKPVIKLHRIDVHQQHAFKEEDVLTDQHVFNQERNSSLDQEDPQPPQIKEEQEELCRSQEGEQLGLKQETDTFMVTPAYEKSDHSKPEPNSDQLFSHSSPEAESRDYEENGHVDSRSTRNAELKNRCHSQRVDNLPVSSSKSRTDTKNKSVQCDVCGKTLQDKYNMITHLRVHTGEKPYSCSTCGKRFSDLSKFKTHMRIHTGEKQYPCSTCEKRFATLSKVKRHMRIHTGEKPYSCSTCGKKICTLSAFKTHTRIHTGEKPYSCSTCGKRFTQLSNFKIHTRIHTGEKPHSCSTCGKGFIQKSRLDCHVRIHTGEKPYCCSTCGKRFADPSAFKKHTRIHTGEKPYSCSTCGKRFTQLSNFKTHTRIHTGEKPYSCSTCGKRFVERNKLKKHMRIHTV
ncbi:zinc finger protein 2-like isoform X2 [Simochromis diagramma]|uniref:zinc finger protein 2-like isoform X2 n=1 Tax=Simochromis diagramma TaxID=43689 RepID=UPI001A7EBDFE|nr:zinc finger protein 2-like isoform X2 [Simochromis diagramma]